MKLICTFMSICLLTVSANVFAKGDAPYRKLSSDDDALRSTVLEVIRDYESGFANVTGEAVGAEERQRIIDNNLDFDVYSQGKSRLERMREAELIADSARQLTVEMPGATNGYFWEHEIVTPNATSVGKYVTFEYHVPFEQRQAKAKELFDRISPLFKGERKWQQSIMTDKNLNPVLAQFMYFYPLGRMSQLFVTVEYPYQEAHYEPYGQVVLRVYRFETQM